MPDNKNAVLYIVMAVYFLVPFMGSALIPAVPDISLELSLSVAEAGGIVSVYVLASAIFLLPVGRVADRIGHMNSMLAGVAGFGINMALCAIAPNGFILLATRFLQGAAAAFIYTSGMTLISMNFSPAERGRALGMVTFMVYIGLSLGSVLGGFMNSAWGWRSIFWGGTILTAVISVFFFMKHLEKDKGRDVRFDKIGNAVYITATTLFFTGFSINGRLGFVMAAAGTMLYTLFFFYEKKAESPLLDVSLFTHNRVFALSNISSLLNYMAASAVLFLVSMELKLIYGFDTFHIGLVLMAQSAGMTISAPLAGKYADKHDSANLSVYGMMIITVTLLLMTFHTGTGEIAPLVAIQFFIGIGFGMFAPTINKTIMNSVDKPHYSTAASVLSSMRLFGQTLSIALSVLVISFFAGHVKVDSIPHDMLIKSLKAVYAVFCAVSFIGTFTTFLGSRKRA